MTICLPAALMDITDLSLQRIKLQALRIWVTLGLLSAGAVGAGGCEDGSQYG